MLRKFSLGLLAVAFIFSATNEASARVRLFGFFRNNNSGGVFVNDTEHSTDTALGVALIQAVKCRLMHLGGNTGPEGVGMGNTADEAISNCCFWGKYTPVDIGVAQGSNGKFYACVRYNN